MDFEISIPSYGLISFVSTIPNDLVDYHLPGSDVYSAELEIGIIMVQQIQIVENTALHFVFVCKRDCVLNIRIASPVLKLHFAIRGNFHWELRDLGILDVKESHCNFYYAKRGLVGKGKFKGSQTYILFDIFYPVNMLNEYRTRYSFLAAYIDKMQTGPSASLFDNIIPISKDMWNLAFPLIRKDPEIDNLFLYEGYSQLLLKHFLSLAAKAEQQPIVALPAHIEKIYIVEQMLHKFHKQPNISAIAAKLQIGERTLRDAFKTIFGRSPIEYWRYVRISRSAEELKDSRKPIKVIAKMSGFNSLMGFLIAFKREYGMSPKEWRKRGGNSLTLVMALFSKVEFGICESICF